MHARDAHAGRHGDVMPFDDKRLCELVLKSLGHGVASGSSLVHSEENAELVAAVARDRIVWTEAAFFSRSPTDSSSCAAASCP